MKGVLIWIIGIVFISPFVNAQESQTEFLKNKKDSILPGRLSIGFGITPSYIIGPNALVFGDYDGYELNGNFFAISYQVDASIRLTNRLSMLTSVSYAQRDVLGRYYCHVCDFFAPVKPERIALRYMEVPLVLRMQFGTGRFGTHVQGGFIGSFLLNEIQTDFGGIQFVENRTNLQGQIGFGINYRFTERIKGLLTANYNHILLGSNPFNFKTAGLNFSLLYHLK